MHTTHTLQLADVNIPDRLTGSYAYSIKLHNTGFGAVLSPRRAYLLLKARRDPPTTKPPEQVDKYTKAATGGRCYFDSSRTDCAICQNGGCACHEAHKGQCVKCGGGDGVCGVSRQSSVPASPTGPMFYHDTGADVRTWGPGETHSVQGSVSIPSGIALVLSAEVVCGGYWLACACVCMCVREG